MFKGHIVAAACVELNLEHPDASMEKPLPQNSTKEEKRDFVFSLANKIVTNFTVIPNAILGSDNMVHSYARVPCHFSALVLEFTDAWSEGDAERVLQVRRCLCSTFIATGEPSMLWRPFDCNCNLPPSP